MFRPRLNTHLSEADKIIAHLKLEPLASEGGFFARTWTSPDKLACGRAAATTIHFLITPTDFSVIHALDADELWFFQAGDPVEHLQLTPGVGANGQVTCLGQNVLGGQLPEITVPRGTWQGARILPPTNLAEKRCGWSLIACTMIPGWRSEGFQLGKRSMLFQLFPQYRSLIETLTRGE